MRVIFMGGGDFGCASLKWLSRSRHEVLQVITQPARPAGRGRKMRATAIAQLARDLHIPFREWDDVNIPEHVAEIRSLKPEIILIIAFGQKIGNELLNLPQCRVINLHSSLLPKYRGAAPINWAIIKGESETGLTVIELNEQWDAGNILGQQKTSILPDETAGELHDRLAEMGPALLEKVLYQIELRQDSPIPQDNSLACRAPKLKKSDGAIDWQRPAVEIYNQIRGMWPWPGSFCYFHKFDSRERKKKLRIARAELVKDETPPEIHPYGTQPGTVANDLSIICNPGRIKLLYVLPENSRFMSFDAFVNGSHIKPGDRFLGGNG